MDVINPHPSYDPLLPAVQKHFEGHLDVAEGLYRQVVAQNPGHAKAHMLLGVVCCQTGRASEGTPYLEAAVQLDRGNAEAWSNLGNAYRTMDRHREAVHALQRSIELDPKFAFAYCNVSPSLRALGRVSDAVAAARRALELQPGLAQAHLNLGHALLDLGETSAAIASFRQALYIQPNMVEAQQGVAFAMLYSDRHTAKEAFQEASRLGAFGQWAHWEPVRIEPQTIAFLSGDFSAHPVAYFLDPVLSAIRSEGRNIVLVATGCRHDDWTDKLRSQADAWIDVSGLDTQQAVSVLRSAHIDVLIDLAGHTANNRWDIVTSRVAPMQASWLGYSGTTGLPNMDLLLADSVTVPDGDEVYASETVVRLGQSLFCWDPSRVEPEVGPLPAASNGFVTFGSFNSLAKVSPATLDVWSRVLHAVPRSRLIVRAQRLGETLVRARLEERLASLGIEAGRLELRDWVYDADPRQAYRDVDIALDTVPYTGATTTIEALSSGVPVVTLAGDRYAARMSASLLASVGHTEWIAETADGMVETAVSLAQDTSGLARVRARLPQDVTGSSLCDNRAFARSLLSALDGEWASRATQRRAA